MNRQRKMKILLLLLLQMPAGGAFVRLCSLGGNALKTGLIDDDTGEVTLVDALLVETQGPDRMLSELPEFMPAIFETSSSSVERSLQSDNETNTNSTQQYVLLRECRCNSWMYPGAYCIAEKDTCGLSSDGTVGCFNQTAKVILVRNAWPIIVLWYAALLLFILFTAQGRNARNFVYIRCCNHNANHNLVDQILRPPPEQQSWWWRRRRRARLPFPQWDNPAVVMAMVASVDDVERPPIRLELKTKRFVAPNNDNDLPDDGEPPTCTICFAPLEDGDRVGALACHHEFHVDCLKTWICRRNVCPLCLVPNVATRITTPVAEQQNGTPEGQAEPPPTPEDRERRSLEITQEPDVDRGRGGPFSGRVILRRNR